MCSTSTQQHYCLRGCASPAAANDAPTLSWPAAHAGDQTNQSVASVQREAERVAGNRARSSLKWYYEYARNGARSTKTFTPLVGRLASHLTATAPAPAGGTWTVTTDEEVSCRLAGH